MQSEDIDIVEKIKKNTGKVGNCKRGSEGSDQCLQKGIRDERRTWR